MLRAPREFHVNVERSRPWGHICIYVWVPFHLHSWVSFQAQCLIARGTDVRHIWNVIYNARSNKSHPPTSPNTAPATQNIALHWAVTLLSCDITELLLDWAVIFLSCYFTGLLLYGALLRCYFTELLLYWATALLSCYSTELLLCWGVTLLSCYFTEPFLYWAATVLRCYFTELVLYWGFTLLSCYFAFLNLGKSEVSQLNFL